MLSFGRRRRWVAIPFPGSAHVAAGPLNPPTLGVGELGLLQSWYRVHYRTKALRGAGAGACWWPPDGNSGLPDGWFYRRKMKDFASGTVPGPDVSPNGSPGGVRRASGELLGAPGRPKVA